MGKLIFKTTKPKKGYTDFTLSGTHISERGEPQPVHERKGLDAVNAALMKLLFEMEQLGYDSTKCYFSISY